MKIGLVAQQKGGDGKTSTIVHVAYDFYERGLRVAVVDLDTQGNASSTLRKFASDYTVSHMFEPGVQRIRQAFSTLPKGPLLCLIAADKELANTRKFEEAAPPFKANIEALAGCRFDVVLIDTAPALNVSLATALNAADCVLSPIQMEAFSIQGIKKMLTVIANIRKVNPKLKFLGMLPNMVDGRAPRQVRNLAELQAAYPQLMIPLTVGRRGSIADAMASCVPVWKIKKTTARTAAREVRAVAAYLFEKMEIAA